MLSFLLKALSASALLAALVGFYMQVSGRQLLDFVPQKNLGIVAIAFLLLAGVLGAADYWVSHSNPTIKQVNQRIRGDVSGTVAGRDVVHQYGPTDEQRIEERISAERLLANEVVAQLGALARREELVALALRPDYFAAEFDQARQALAPSTAQANSASYRQLIAAETASSLRHALESERLRSEPSDLLRQTLLKARIDSSRFDVFYQQMAEVERHTRAILRRLDSFGRRSWSHGTTQLHDLLEVEFQLLVSANATATEAGLRIIDSLEATIRRDVQTRIELIPLTLAGSRDFANSENFSQDRSRQEALNAKRAELVEGSAGARDNALEAGLAEIEAMLAIDDEDSAQEVIGKARSLRELGRIGEAVAAYQRYAVMFEATDSLALDFVAVAQKFSMQSKDLGVQGGCYVGTVETGAPGAKAGLQKSDIIVKIDGIEVTNVIELVDALSAATEEYVTVTYLRIDSDSTFVQKTTRLGEPRIGAEVRSI